MCKGVVIMSGKVVLSSKALSLSLSEDDVVWHRILCFLVKSNPKSFSVLAVFTKITTKRIVHSRLKSSLLRFYWSPSWIGWSIWYQCISTSCGPVTRNSTIRLPLLGLTSTQIGWFHDGYRARIEDAYPTGPSYPTLILKKGSWSPCLWSVCFRFIF